MGVVELEIEHFHDSARKFTIALLAGEYTSLLDIT